MNLRERLSKLKASLYRVRNSYLELDKLVPEKEYQVYYKEDTEDPDSKLFCSIFKYYSENMAGNGHLFSDIQGDGKEIHLFYTKDYEKTWWVLLRIIE